ncbi:MAG: hypothetical protein P8J35_01675 [Candidatus Marinimicrobia bacterium]|nr:hypothetical protein [Candidatus Neomarinimicrobiota bacterium]
MQYSLIYQSKIIAVKECLNMLQINLEDILFEYNDECFSGSKIQKKELFNNILEKRSYSNEEAQFMQERCGGLARFRDKRTGIEYATDLILGWISEDAILYYFNSNNIKAEKYGTDKEREFLQEKSISAQSDLILSTLDGENIRKLEYMNDWTGFWKRANKLHLRENKYLKIKEENAIFLGITPVNQEGLVVETTNSTTRWHRISSHYPYGGKPAWELSDVKKYMKKIDKVLDETIKLILR